MAGGNNAKQTGGKIKDVTWDNFGGLGGVTGYTQVEQGGLPDPMGISSRITTHLTGGPPERSFAGGSQEALDAQRGQYGGMGANSYAAGGQAWSQGLGTMGQAAGQAQADRNAAYGYAAQGQGIGSSGLAGQNAAVANARGIAAQSTDSLAQRQLQAQSAANQRQMMGMAAQARGGNQAAAMRNAQLVGSQMQLQTNEQAAQLRAGEQQAAINRQLGVESMAANVGGQQAGLGYGMYGQGLGMAQGATGQLAGIGGNMASAGLGQQNVGLGAYGLLNDLNIAQLEADRANASAAAVAKSPAGVVGNVLGAWF
jgi:hypothetical protein